MKLVKIIGILFIVTGILFAIIGTIRYVVSFAGNDDRVYTTARIVKIDERETGDSEFPIDYTTYVEFDLKGDKITSVLNTYKSSFKLGKQINIYYFEKNLQTVYQTESNIFYIIFASVGLVFTVLGVILVLKKDHPIRE